MSADIFNRRIDWDALGKTSSLNSYVRQHLVRVYSLLTITILTSAVGSLVYLTTGYLGGMLATLSALGLMVAILFTPKHEVMKRVALLLAFGFFQGTSLGPLLARVIQIDPSIVTSAFLGTAVIFGCFSGASLLAERRSYLYIGGLLSSGLSILCLLSLANIFAGSMVILNVQLYLGLIVFCGFIIFDTQLIIERAYNKDDDYVGHALQLFIDFVAVFVRLLIILSKNNKNQKKKNNSR
eukprot:TRINITY_DN3301_c0_g2_i1.p1 TRINITY_DN3301_c0_g2~~TRINITY_DN3301_c0_g2_i1.p1  ORF type:complete len:239 (+),score=42.48 TRINITY_DN3301_c0_g2_i1:170-886(+)